MFKRKLRLQYNWSIELYGLGFVIRKLIRYPKFFPIFAFSDHGVTFWEDIPLEFEDEKNAGKLFFSWNPNTVKIRENKEGIKVVGVKHPWVTYRSKMKYEIQESAKGTIFFPFHHAPGYEFSGYSDNEAISRLKELPEEYQPVRISLHHHDFNSGRHEFYAREGFEIVTSGDGTKETFVDNFYKNAIRHKYAISQGVGSQLFYLVEIGIPVQVYPTVPVVIDSVTKNNIVTNEGYVEHARIQEMFKDPLLHITQEQRELAEYYLGFYFPEINKFRMKLYKLALTVGIPWLISSLLSLRPTPAEK